jgi:hypothetical protein
MLVEIEGDTMHYQAISRAGATVDSGVITRRPDNVSASPKSAPSVHAEKAANQR